MKKKIFGILVGMLFIIGVFTSAANLGAINEKKVTEPIDEILSEEHENEKARPDIDILNGVQRVVKPRIKYFVREGWNKNLTNITKNINEIFEGTNISFVWNGTSIELRAADGWWTNETDFVLRELKNKTNCSQGINVVLSPIDYLDAGTNGVTYFIVCNGTRSLPEGGVVVKDTCNEAQITNTIAHELMHALGCSHEQVKWFNTTSGVNESKPIWSRVRNNAGVHTSWRPPSKPSPPHGYGYYDDNGDCNLNRSEGEIHPSGGWDIDGDCNFSAAEDQDYLLWGRSDRTNDNISEEQRDYMYTNALLVPGARVDVVGEATGSTTRPTSSRVTHDIPVDIMYSYIDIKGAVGIIYFDREYDDLLRLSCTIWDDILSTPDWGEIIECNFYIDIDNDPDTGSPPYDHEGSDWKVSFQHAFDGSIASLCKYLGETWACFGTVPWDVSQLSNDYIGDDIGGEDVDNASLIKIDIPLDDFDGDFTYDGDMKITVTTMTTVDQTTQCGDVTGDGVINIADVVFLTNYIMGTGSAPDPLCIGDANGDGVIDLADVLVLYEPGSIVEDCCIDITDEAPPFYLSKEESNVPVLNLEPSAGFPDTDLAILGHDFTAWSEITVYFGGNLHGTVDSDGNGDFSYFMTIPSIEPGLYQITCVGPEGEWHMRLFKIYGDIICGDANDDGIVNVSDVVYIINYIFIPDSGIPDPLCSADANGDGIVNVSDAVYLINWIFIPGFPPPVEDCC